MSNKNTADTQNQPKKKRSFILNALRGMLFGVNREEMNPLEEEALRSPVRTIIAKFFSNKVALSGMICLLLVFIACFALSYIYPLDLKYYDLSQTNIEPGFSIMDYPDELDGSARQFGIGSTFGVAIGDEGRLYQWNKLSDPITNVKLQNIPAEAVDLKLVSAGLDHVLAVTNDNQVLTWGNNRLRLDRVPNELKNGEVEIKQIIASSQYSIALSNDGHLYFWGNSNLVTVDQDVVDYSRWMRRLEDEAGNWLTTTDENGDTVYQTERTYIQGHIVQVAANENNIVMLMDDGTVNVIGVKGSVFGNVPDDVPRLVSVAVTDSSFAAGGIDERGNVYIWGNDKDGILDIPEEVMGHAVKLVAGRSFFTALTDTGHVYSWGRSVFNETDSPDTGDIVDVYSGYYQNYAIKRDGSIVSWGLKGYFMGSDNQGRDVFRRLLHGGRMTLTVGAVSVIIAMIIGVIVGGIAGYYGGKPIDTVLMRMAEVVGSIPFLPLAMTLSAMIGNSMSESGRISMIMVILGILSWPPLARLIRGQILAEREKEFVTAAKAVGVKERVIIFRHIMPNVLSVIIVNVTLRFATAMLTESSLSFLGFGVVPPTPTWGNMLSNSQDSKVIRDYWWRWVFPAVSLAISTISINLIGDGLRDAVDPKSGDR